MCRPIKCVRFIKMIRPDYKNKRALYDFEILDQLKAGIVLTGWQAKGLNSHCGDINSAWCRFKADGLYMVSCKITAPPHTLILEHGQELSDKKLLLSKKELLKLKDQIKKGLTIIVLSIHSTKTGLWKANIALARPKKKWDKRQTIKERDIKRAESYDNKRVH